MGDRQIHATTFDVLYWNNDTTRLPTQLHGEMLDLLYLNLK